MQVMPPCELDGAAIVLVGSFNPKIYQPAWLAHHKLIRDEEAEAADIRMVRPELTDFTAGWLTLQVLTERFTASTADPSKFKPLCDLVIGVFSILQHTPAKQLGIDRTMHYRMPSEEKFRAFGHMLAPKEVALATARTRVGVRDDARSTCRESIEVRPIQGRGIRPCHAVGHILRIK